jgi:magnesium transporter
MDHDNPHTRHGDWLEHLVLEAQRRAPLDVALLLMKESDETVGHVVKHLQSTAAYRVLMRFPESRRHRIVQFAGDNVGDPWSVAQGFPEDSVGRLLEPAVAVFAPDLTVREAVEKIRLWVHDTLITYVYVVDPAGALIGVVAMRDLLLARPDQTLGEVMLGNPFSLDAHMPLSEAMRGMVHKHFPVLSGVRGRAARGHRLGIEALRGSTRSRSPRRPAAWSASRRRNVSARR